MTDKYDLDTLEAGCLTVRWRECGTKKKEVFAVLEGDEGMEEGFHMTLHYKTKAEATQALIEAVRKIRNDLVDLEIELVVNLLDGE